MPRKIQIEVHYRIVTNKLTKEWQATPTHVRKLSYRLNDDQDPHFQDFQEGIKKRATNFMYAEHALKQEAYGELEIKFIALNLIEQL